MRVCRHGRSLREPCWECGESHWQTIALVLTFGLLLGIALAKALSG